MCLDFGAATLIAAAVSPFAGSYSSPELSLATGDAARFFLDLRCPMSETDKAGAGANGAICNYIV